MKRSRREPGGRVAAPRSTPAAPARPAPAWLWPALLAVALAALLWSVRGAPLGTPVADDYAFLARLRFQRPLDIFDSMGAAYYWRPLSRQLYFSLVGPWLVAAPWGAALLNTLILAATAGLLYRGALRVATRPVACAVALAPLVAEGSRVLVDWPSAIQHVLAMFFTVLALERALARDRIGAPLAALAALLSHEASFPVLLVLPAAAGLAARSGREAVRFGALAGATAIVWAVGYRVAIQHGVALPPGAAAGPLAAGWPRIAGAGLRATLNLEDLGATFTEVFTAGYVLLAIATLALLIRPAARRDLRRSLPAAGLGLACFLIGVAPLTAVLPDWNAWRASLPALALAVSATVALAAAHPGLALGFATLRLFALLIAPLAPAKVQKQPPATRSHFSLPSLSRLQRIVDSTRVTLLARYPTLPSASVARYWAIPNISEVAFHGSDALRVWYRDSTAVWERFAGLTGIRKPPAVLVEYDCMRPPLVAVVDHDALALFIRAAQLQLAGRLDIADTLYLAASRAEPRKACPFQAALARNRAMIAISYGNLPLADSLNRVDLDLAGESPATWTVTAAIAFALGDTAAGRRALTHALRWDPNHQGAVELARVYLGK